jgi:hypothetical protein
MKLKIFDFKVREDYGRDIYLTLLQLNRWCLVQSCFSYMMYPANFPYLSIIFGSGRLLGINFQWLHFGFTVELFSRSWFK